MESSWLKSPGLKGLGLKLGVEKSGVEMSSQSMGLKLGVEKPGVEMSWV